MGEGSRPTNTSGPSALQFWPALSKDWSSTKLLSHFQPQLEWLTDERILLSLCPDRRGDAPLSSLAEVRPSGNESIPGDSAGLHGGNCLVCSVRSGLPRQEKSHRVGENIELGCLLFRRCRRFNRVGVPAGLSGRMENQHGRGSNECCGSDRVDPDWHSGLQGSTVMAKCDRHRILHFWIGDDYARLERRAFETKP